MNQESLIKPIIGISAFLLLLIVMTAIIHHLWKQRQSDKLLKQDLEVSTDSKLNLKESFIVISADLNDNLHLPMPPPILSEPLDLGTPIQSSIQSHMHQLKVQSRLIPSNYRDSVLSFDDSIDLSDLQNLNPKMSTLQRLIISKSCEQTESMMDSKSDSIVDVKSNSANVKSDTIPQPLDIIQHSKSV
ncbi:hypothetical protein BC833DRAFT_657477 [Globomyces pollinis-pini]|nr:hypothetical protein BC833DRAFT_657477 [Globomyces pollinis-pini]KAJ2997988.1 hypothetical protein HDV02_004990 [Globomyces sp. JEL0801]